MGQPGRKLIIHDIDFRIVAEGAVSTPVTLQPVGGGPPVGLLAWITGLEPAEPPIEPPPPGPLAAGGADGLGFGVGASAPRAMNLPEGRVNSILFRIRGALYFKSRKVVFPPDTPYDVLRHPLSEWDKLLREVFHDKAAKVLGNVFGCAFVHATEDPFTTLWLGHL
jgi:hypothetical protein